MLEDLDVDLDGAALLDELHALLTDYVVVPSDAAADAITLWIAATHALPAFQHAPRLAIKSPEKRCGKSRLLDVISGTCHIPLMTANATVAAVFRSLSDEHPPTLLIDEADTLFGTKKAAENNEDFRALLNAGHQRGRPALRCVGPPTGGHRVPHLRDGRVGRDRGPTRHDHRSRDQPHDAQTQARRDCRVLPGPPGHPEAARAT